MTREELRLKIDPRYLDEQSQALHSHDKIEAGRCVECGWHGFDLLENFCPYAETVDEYIEPADFHDANPLWCGKD